MTTWGSPLVRGLALALGGNVAHGVLGHGGNAEARVHAEVGRHHGAVDHVDAVVAVDFVLRIDDPTFAIERRKRSPSQVSLDAFSVQRCPDVIVAPARLAQQLPARSIIT